MLEELKRFLSNQGFLIASEKEIQYGAQFVISKDNVSGVIRFFSGKKGDKLDFSQLKDVSLKEAVVSSLRSEKAFSTVLKSVAVNESKKSVLTSTPLFEEAFEKGDLIGVDESGKGDYFGPLVIASVFVSKENYETLLSLGVMDSKRLNDDKILALSHQIRTLCPVDTVIISNPKYNELYASFRNLNTLLAWWHSQTIENMVSKVACKQVLCDQFGKQSLIETAIKQKGLDVDLRQAHKAESTVAVAAASIIAREGYITALAKLSHEYGLSFPKGISSKTISCVKAFEKKFGTAALPDVSKSHFKLKGL